MKTALLTTAIAVATLLAAPAAAVESVGTFAASIVGVSSDTPSIGVGTTFTNTLFSVVGSGTGDFGGLSATTFSVSALTASIGEAFTFTSVFGNFAGTVQTAFATGPTTNRTVGAYVLGTFSPLGTLSGFDAGAASTTFSFTQTGLGGAVSGSFSFASPPSPIPEVPEPAAWALLIAGFTLVGTAARRRRVQVLA